MKTILYIFSMVISEYSTLYSSDYAYDDVDMI